MCVQITLTYVVVAIKCYANNSRNDVVLVIIIKMMRLIQCYNVSQPYNNFIHFSYFIHKSFNE